MKHILAILTRLKPGMNLKDVRRIAVSEAGLQDPMESVFQLKVCHFIKIRVAFASPTWVAPASDGISQREPNPVIVRISEPFIGFPRDLD